MVSDVTKSNSFRAVLTKAKASKGKRPDLGLLPGLIAVENSIYFCTDESLNSFWYIVAWGAWPPHAPIIWDSHSTFLEDK